MLISQIRKVNNFTNLSSRTHIEKLNMETKSHL